MVIEIESKILEIKEFSFWYGNNQALFKINLPIYKNKITAIIGPSGCGKSTLLRSLNRINDLLAGSRHQGEINFHEQNIYEANDIVMLRKKIGMVFQRPCPFPMSVRANIEYGPKMHGIKDGQKLNEIVSSSLKQAALWEEVSEDLNKSALSLSGGQQQRLCIARSLSIAPEIILMDEPTSALDPIATAKIESLMSALKEKYTIIIVTHNMQQAARISDYTAFMHLGKLIEFGETEQLFQNPQQELTAEYLAGKFG